MEEALRPEKHAGGGRGYKRVRPRAWKLTLQVLALTLGDPPGWCLW